MIEEIFTSGGKTFKITIYPGSGDGKKYPILILLHGNFGLGEPYGSQIRDFAESLSGKQREFPLLGNPFVGPGYVTAVPQYYDDDGDHPTDENPAPHVATLTAAIQHIAGHGLAIPTESA